MFLQVDQSIRWQYSHQIRLLGNTKKQTYLILISIRFIINNHFTPVDKGGWEGSESSYELSLENQGLSNSKFVVGL